MVELGIVVAMALVVVSGTGRSGEGGGEEGEMPMMSGGKRNGWTVQN